MGVLDDAIREHLELKRKHGASEGEVEQQEQEALGAPRRQPPEQANGEGPEQAGAATAEPQGAEAAMPVPDEEITAPETEPAVDETDVAPEAEVRPEVAEPEALEPEPALDDAPPAAVEPDPAAELPAEEPGDDEPDWDFGGEPSEPEPPRGGDTPPRGFERVEDAPPADDDEDVLEETPDFLQETPEHDRLWFEQKPPRDFDFDDDK